MPRGGFRAGAGRKTNAERLALDAARTALGSVAEPLASVPVEPTVESGTAEPRGYTLPSGEKAADAPEGWPFGTVPAAPVVEPVPDETPMWAHAAVAAVTEAKVLTAREYLVSVVNDLQADDKMRLDAAKRLIEFEEAKPGALGIKAGRLEAAKRVSGKYAAAAPPRLALVGKAGSAK